MEELKNVQPLRGAFPTEVSKSRKQTLVSEGTHNFKDTLQGLVKDVDKMQKNAEETSRRLLTGEIEDVHQVMVAMEEAQTSFQLMMEIRNKIVEAYKEVLRMQV